ASAFPSLGSPGSYVVVAHIKASGTSPAAGYDTFSAASVSWTACDWTTTTPNPVQLSAGPAQNFNVAASGPGCLSPTYRVFMYNVGTGWVTLSNWTPGSTTDGSLTYGVATGSLANGNYSLDVHANQGNVTIDPNNPETWGLSTMIIGPAPCNYAPSVTVAEGNPADDGAVLHFTASVGGSPCATPAYDWWVYGPQHQWIELTTGYVSSNTLTIDTSSFNWGGGIGLQPGTYSIDVHIKQPSTPATSYDTYALLSLTLRGCVAGYGWVSQNPVPASKTIGVYAGAGCDAPMFRYSVMTPGSSTWILLADYSTNSVYYYDTTGKALGNYLFKVEIKETNSPQAVDTFMYAQSAVVSG
ncbi:MAG TPA: hypothetical protein VJQ08_01885, partial [Candidatus Dormibacteraeota bacterium]|nr:hypothetical protein [Candidatus Dormibacteraeota bacterium]